MTDVTAPDGSIITFPDDMPPEAIQQVMEQNFPRADVDQDISKSVLTGVKDFATGAVGLPGTVEGLLGQGVDAFAQAQGSDYRYPRMLPNISEVNAAVDPYLPEALNHEPQTTQGEVASWGPAIVGALMGRPSANTMRKLSRGTGAVVQASAIPMAMGANAYGPLASGATFAGTNWLGKLLKRLGGEPSPKVIEATYREIAERIAKEPKPLTPEQYIKRYGEDSNAARNARELARRLEIDEMAKRRGNTLNLYGDDVTPPWAQ
jgi:hypothetical protein